MSTDGFLARNEGYWEDLEDRAAFLNLPAWRQKRLKMLSVPFYGWLCAYHRATGDSIDPENPPSVPTCERSPSPGVVPDFSIGELHEPEWDALRTVLGMGVNDVNRAIEIVQGGGDRLEAVYEAVSRDQDRQWKVFALLERGDVSQALRLATCGQRSIQLTCPDHSGGCGCEENFVPMHCDSRLCPDCNSRRIGQNIEKYRDAVFEMEAPSFWTLTMTNFADPIVGRREVMEALGKLRRRTIPFEGSVTRETDDGETIEKSWCWWRGVDVEDFDAVDEQWKVRLQEEGLHDLVRRLQQQYVNYEYTNITGTHVGRNIPMDELVQGGVYGIDIKQKGPFEFNVHAHVLVDSAYIPQAALSAAWEDITGDPVVDTRRIYNRSGKESVAQVLAETVGYAFKPPEFEEQENEIEFVEAVKGCPTVHPFGSLHGAGKDTAGMLRCSRCDQTPIKWEYGGVVDHARDNMGKNWDTEGDRPPP